MNILLLNLLLALSWVFLTGEMNFGSFFEGLLLGYVILWVVSYPFGNPKYFKKIFEIAGFILFFIREVILSNLKVAYDIVTPQNYMKPGVVAIPLDIENDIQIMIMANFITLTPGTLSLDVSDDKKVLYVHAMYIGDKEQFKKELKENLEKRIIKVFS